MADITKRMNYFDRQFLRAKDFEDEQDYHIDRRRRHNTGFHGYGIVEGLEVVPDTGTQVNIQPGWAIDSQGREIVLAAPGDSVNTDGVAVNIWISYPDPEPQSDPSTDPGALGNTRIHEKPVVGFAVPTDGILLATVEATNLVAAGNIDNDVKQFAALQDDSVTSAMIAEADTTTLQDTDNGTGVKTGHIQDRAVTDDKIANNAVTTAKIANNAVTAAKIGNGEVRTAELASGAVTSVKIADGTIPEAKLTSATSGKLVTNGDSHDHEGGDGAQIAHSSLNLNDGANPHGTTAADIGAVPITGANINTDTIKTDNLGVRVAAEFDGPATFSQRVQFQLGARGNSVIFDDTSRPLVIFDAPVTFRQGVRFRTGKPGYVADVFLNCSGQVLHTGDLVKLKSSGVAGFYGINNRVPIPAVTLADSEDDPSVIGIVDQEVAPDFDEPDNRADPEDPTSIPDGGQLFGVTLGAYAHCKVDATDSPIQVGDLLTSSANPGHAKKATDPKIGSIIGKALESLETGIGYIAVFVNIQ